MVLAAQGLTLFSFSFTFICQELSQFYNINIQYKQKNPDFHDHPIILSQTKAHVNLILVDYTIIYFINYIQNMT